MRKNKPLILIAIVAMMLVAAPSAYAYSEHWAGFFSGGTVTYNNRTYTYLVSSAIVPSYIYAWTYDANDDSITGNYLDTYTGYFDWDSIGIDTTFYDTLEIELVDYGSYKKMLGTKDTGTTGTKEGSGTWTGHCTRTTNNATFYLIGTWNTGTDIDTKYFNYNPTPPIGNGYWAITQTWPANTATGGGLWQSERTSYSP